jgi:hypothetical protein
MALRITAAQLLGNFCETLFFGIYLVTCVFCAPTLPSTKHGQEERLLRPSEIRWFTVVVAITLFSIQTFDVAIGLLHNFHAFVESDNPKTVFLENSDWINIARVSTLYLNDL